MLEVFDRDRWPVARLENAFNVTETRKINAVNKLGFSLPRDDPKAEYCTPFAIVAMDRGEKFRITKVSDAEGEENAVTYECEHVMGLLIDTAMDGYHVIGNVGVYTRDVLNYVLSFQTDWILGECDFSRQFEYGWEKETLLSALFSVPNRFVEKYIFVTNTTIYPYRVSLKGIDEAAEPVARARRGHNRIKLSREIDYTKIATRIIPYGAGEGVNQVNIAAVNGGVKYVQSPPEIIAKYGVITKIWSDRRYTSPEELRNAALALLVELQEPFAEYEVDFVGDADLGDVVEIVGVTRSYVTEVKIEYGEDTRKTYTIANRTTDIAASLADLADRQNIETCYSQGATQVWADNIQTNADATDAAVMSMYIPAQMLILNSVDIKIKMSRYRGEVKPDVAGGSVKTSSTQPASTPTSSTQPASTPTSGASSTSTTGTETSTKSGQSTNTGVMISISGNHYHAINWGGGSSGVPEHNHDIEHTHKTNIPAHNHTVDIPAHNHTVDIPAHNHTVDTTHTHDLSPAFTYWGGATGFWLQVNGKSVAYVNGSSYEGDIAALLANAQGIVPRGQWLTIGCLPNDRARFDISYTAQGFIQSRGGGQY